MKVIHYDATTGELKLVPDTLDDLWHLDKVLAKGDLVEGHSFRSYKVGTREERKSVFITVSAESVEFSKSLNRLRVLGKIVAGHPEEFVQLGRHHTVEVESGSKIKITKPGGWKKHQLDRLRSAEKESKKPQLRIIVLDEEKALTAMLRAFGVEYGPEIYSSTSKRDEKHEQKEKEYFGNIMAEIEAHPEKYIVAGPGFVKDNLKKFISQKKPALLARIIFESCSYAERSGVNELLKRGVVEQVMGEERMGKETKLIEEFLAEVHKDTGRAAYGPKEVKSALEAHAVGKLFVLDEYLRASDEAEALVDLAEKGGAEVIVFSSEGDAGFKLKGFGKIAAMLRFRMKE